MSESVCFNGCDLNYERILEKDVGKCCLMRLTPSGSFVAYYEDITSVFGYSEGAKKASWYIRIWEGEAKNMGSIIWVRGTYDLPDKERERFYIWYLVRGLAVSTHHGKWS